MLRNIFLRITKNFSTVSKGYYTPENVIGDKITLKDIHDEKAVILQVKNPETTKSARKEAKQGILVKLAKAKFPNLQIDKPEDIQFYAKTSSELRTFISDFNILFATAQRMPYKYFDNNITFEVWVEVLEGRERKALLSTRQSAEISKLADERKATLLRHSKETDELLGSAKTVVQIDALTVEHLPVEVVNIAKAVGDDEAQSKRLKEELIAFKAKELARYAKNPNDYLLPKRN